MNVTEVLLTEDGLQILLDGETQDGEGLMERVPMKSGGTYLPSENVYIVGLALAWADENAQLVKAEYTGWSTRQQLQLVADGKVKAASAAKVMVQASDQYVERKTRIAHADRIKMCCAALQDAVKQAAETGV